MGVKIGYGAIILCATSITGCSHTSRNLKGVSEIRIMGGSCNVIIGENAEYDSNKSYQVVIKPTSELEREYAISVVQRFIQDHPSDHKCMSVYQEALRQLQFNFFRLPSKPGEKL